MQAAPHRAQQRVHGTPFKTRRIDEARNQLNGFHDAHEGYDRRWSHMRRNTRRNPHAPIVGARCHLPRRPAVAGGLT